MSADVYVAQSAPTEATEYHSLSPAAVASLVCGLLSPLALVGPLLMIVPVVGVGLAWLGLRAIARSGGEVVGRGIALGGLALSLGFAAAAPAQSVAAAWTLTAASRPIADQFFEFLRHDQPHYALQLTTVPNARRVLNENLWEFYGANKENREQLTKWVEKPVVRFLLEQGQNAQVRFYQAGTVLANSDPQYIELIYAVTYNAEGKRSFFVKTTVERRTLRSGEAFWRVADVAGGYQPPGFGE